MSLNYVYRGKCRFCSTPLERVLASRWDGDRDFFSVDCPTDACDRRPSLVDLIGVRRGDGVLVPIHHFDGWKIVGEVIDDDEFEVLVMDYVGSSEAPRSSVPKRDVRSWIEEIAVSGRAAS